MRVLSNQHQVLVRSQMNDLPWLDLLPILQCVMPVKFRASKWDDDDVGGIIAAERDEGPHFKNSGTIPSLRVPAPLSSARDGELIDISVDFADDPDVPFPFRARSLRGKVAVEPEALSLRRNEKALAVSDAGPVWSLSREGETKHFRSTFAVPAVASDGNLRDVLNGERLMEVLPLLQFMHEVCGSSMLEGPPLRACFMFDDPNLHWDRYGFVDFREIAASA